jgi:uncharacterized protein YraI
MQRKSPLLGALVLAASPLLALAGTVEVTASALNLRSGPGTNYSVVTTASRGQRYESVSSSGSWTQLRASGRTVWGYNPYLKTVASSSGSTGSGATSSGSTSSGSSSSGETYVVTAGALNVRSGPGTGYRRIGGLSSGDRVTVTGSQGEWKRIRLSNGEGWVHGDYLSRTSSSGSGSSGSGSSGSGSSGNPTLPRSRVGFVQLPSSGYGYFGYYSASRRWGTTTMVYGIIRIGRRFKDARSSNPSVGIGDISLENGGDISGHASHERGVDVDVRPIRNDGTSGPTTIFQSIYSRTLTQQVIDLFVAETPVTMIFFNDRNTRHTQTWPNHDNHFHVRIR